MKLLKILTNSTNFKFYCCEAPHAVMLRHKSLMLITGVYTKQINKVVGVGEGGCPQGEKLKKNRCSKTALKQGKIPSNRLFFEYKIKGVG